jgi:hypothetical protein
MKTSDVILKVFLPCLLHGIILSLLLFLTGFISLKIYKEFMTFEELFDLSAKFCLATTLASFFVSCLFIFRERP